MLSLKGIKRVVVLGGGTAGWYTALSLRKLFSANVEIRVVESTEIGIVGVGEGGLLNFQAALHSVDIDFNEFVRETNATFKWGFCYEGWRTGERDDKYYHPFASASGSASKWEEMGHYPLFSAMINKGIPLTSYLKGFDLIVNNASQEEARNALNNQAVDIINSFHFDSYKIAKYLKKVALSRNIIHQDVIVDHVETNEKGHVTALITQEQEKIELDFLVDATGLARKVIGKAVPSEWFSFKEHLLLDRALPFYMPHPLKNPYLVSRAIAMKSGWMWQIPLIDRVGAGYVYSSKHISDDDALQEIKDYLGYEVTPQQNVIKFEPGCYRQVWVGNVLTVGLASGFVEPLEATSIGQMIEVVRNFTRVLVTSQGVVSDNAIREFNESNFASWMEILDFLRMHYDCPRRDTAFWQDVAKTPLTENYRAFKECMQVRAPRLLDIESYMLYGRRGMFHVVNWMFVAAGLGLIPPGAVVNDLMAIAPEKKQAVVDFLNSLNQ
ncbi:tryptophan halogenase [Trabulsiella guamensis ATCC 49490]|uniref:Tryptophan halogenase n=1 Tax=Trabulsiella guamensis ATCC 49490 TaxID=1005994 RepID=A0A085A7N8_9ENTR|nr:tryptophan halogenase family protein [Trabulsiella guamensis]KFC06233.1 tryptophan halogenase [Trabulsiella guamensis ATCC 49490]